MSKVAIIGAGASGMCSAIMIKRLNPNIEVTIFEANDRVGKKLALTGNGRCNISNTALTFDRYHGDSDFAMRIIEKFDFQKQKAFFESIGIPFKVEDEGKAFPYSLQASSVVDMLRFELNDLGVKLFLNTKIEKIQKTESDFIVYSKKEILKFDSVIIATGGKTYSKISTDSYHLLKSFGHKIEKLSPAIVQIKTDTSIIKQLKGIKIQGSITIKNKLITKTEKGEILFCDYGISGPPVLQLSRYANTENTVVVLDFFPEISKDELKRIIESRISCQKTRVSSELFTGFVNKRLGQVILKVSGCNINSLNSDITQNQILNICNNFKNFTLKVTGTLDFDSAQVTAGGAQTTQFFDTLMSKKVKGLFAAGEVLDVDGDCGGFNLAFAWACSNTVANSCVDYLEKGK